MVRHPPASHGTPQISGTGKSKEKAAATEIITRMNTIKEDVLTDISPAETLSLSTKFLRLPAIGISRAAQVFCF